MGRYSRDDVIRMVEEEDVEFIRLQFTDIRGSFKNVAITSSQLTKALDNQYMFDGSSLGFVGIEESDMYLHPDLDTFEVFPWRPQQGKVARLICDVHRPDGRHFEGDPRYILKKVIAEAAEMGYRFNVGPECEFFLFSCDEDGMPTTQAKEQAGFFDVGPKDNAENVRRDIVLNLEELGFEVESSYHESASGQHEVDFRYAEALKTADNVMTFKMTVKSIARRHGLHATFMPKPVAGVNGSGMHINMSLSDAEGNNVFSDPGDENGLSMLAYQFLAGIMYHAPGMTALTNPVVNSYKRLIPGYEAPVYMTWARNNRSPLVRVPETRDNNSRVELRSPDASANPYLALAACLASGLDGIRRQLTPPPKSEVNLFAMTKEEIALRGISRLPGNLGEAIEALEQDALLRGMLGGFAFPRYVQAKKAEWDAYCAQVTEWEVKEYLNEL